MNSMARGLSAIIVSGRGALASVAVAALLGALWAGPALAQAQARGPETNLPLPRYVSLKVDEAYARRGPAQTHRIDWVFKRRAMPLQIVAEYGHWRRVRDAEGAGGWMHYALISGTRTVLVTQEQVDLHLRPFEDAPIVARFERGVIARLGDCDLIWCRISKQGHRGWVRKTALWGVAPEEVRD